MQHAISISLPIVLALVLLPVIALPIPVDPSWIAGVYDDADGDDIVSLVYETSAANTALPSNLDPLPCLLDMSPVEIGRNVADRYVTRGPRSPPVLCSLEFTPVFNSLPPPSGTVDSVSLASITNVPCLFLTTSRTFDCQRINRPTKDMCSTHVLMPNQEGTPLHRSPYLSPSFSPSPAFRSRSLSRFRRPSRSRSDYLLIISSGSDKRSRPKS